MDSRTQYDKEIWIGLLREFLLVVVNSVLYARDIYPKGIFKAHRKYQIAVQICQHSAVQQYIKTVLDGVERVMSGEESQIEKIIIEFKEQNTKTVVEQYVIDMQYCIKLSDAGFADLLDIEQSFRTLLLKIYCSSTQLDRLPEDCDWSMQIMTNHSAYQRLQQDQLVHDVPWVEVTSIFNEDHSAAIIPLSATTSSALQIQMYVLDKRASIM